MRRQAINIYLLRQTILSRIEYLYRCFQELKLLCLQYKIHLCPMVSVRHLFVLQWKLLQFNKGGWHCCCWFGFRFLLFASRSAVAVIALVLVPAAPIAAVVVEWLDFGGGGRLEPFSLPSLFNPVVSVSCTLLIPDDTLCTPSATLLLEKAVFAALLPPIACALLGCTFTRTLDWFLDKIEFKTRNVFAGRRGNSVGYSFL